MNSFDGASFGEAIAWQPDGAGALAGSVPSQWMQGRTSFGGIAAAVGLRALRIAEAEGRRPRSLHTTFFAPLRAEPARVTSEVVRRGRFLTHARADIVQGDTVTTQITATFADDRESKVRVEPPRAPARPDPQTLSELPYVEGVTPRFTEAFAFRWTDGRMPFSGASEPVVGGWCRHRTDPGIDPYVAVVGLIDAWPAPLVPMFSGPAPASSVTWTTNFYSVPETIDPAGWWWFRSEGVAARDGHAGTRGALYTPHGELSATVEQLVALFG